MPRVNVRTKNRAGAKRSCGKCGEEILPSEKYKSWSFRYGGTYYRCYRTACAPRQSDLTQSKMAEVYRAVEGAEEDIARAGEISEIKDAVSTVEEATQEVAEEYREAAEMFNGEGENAERADELESWVDELSGFYPDDTAEVDDVRSDAEELISGCPL